MIRALAGWMLVQPLGAPRDGVCVGRVHSIGELHDDELTARIPFSEGDRVCWSEDAKLHAITDALALLQLASVLAYEPLDDVVSGNGDVE